MRIEQEHDIEVLRQVARLLEKENQRLHERLRVLVAELETLKGAEAGRLQLEIELLQQALARQRQALFGGSSERQGRPLAEGPAPPALNRRQGHGPRPQPRLPLVEAVHELSATERDCPACGGQVSEMAGQFEEAEEISLVQRRFVLVRRRRKKCRCRCNGAVVTAPTPPKLQAGGHYEALASPLVHADETHWRFMGKVEQTARWWIWAVASREAICYQILSSRSQSAARAVLGEYAGIAVVDGYGAFGALSKAGGRFRLAHCWAHYPETVVIPSRIARGASEGDYARKRSG
ncbi:MAG: transposase [Candidatus Eisenbacteria bacterium]|uniref:Transposase n=1 Tax=Eiseniibacteriota bacterium TaxID=2212470 RepID=A0A937X9V0_UNCEI|nr:transposase [Candidatus Eisenbacteria bacterium]